MCVEPAQVFDLTPVPPAPVDLENQRVHFGKGLPDAGLRAKGVVLRALEDDMV